MGFQINTEHDEALFRAYVAQRDAIRDVMGNGVYPNLTKALTVYEAFDSILNSALVDDNLLAYHVELMKPIAPYVAQLRAGAHEIIEIMQAIEAASPGTFGIALAGPQIETPSPSAPVIEAPVVADAA